MSHWEVKAPPLKWLRRPAAALGQGQGVGACFRQNVEVEEDRNTDKYPGCMKPNESEREKNVKTSVFLEQMSSEGGEKDGEGK